MKKNAYCKERKSQIYSYSKYKQNIYKKRMATGNSKYPELFHTFSHK
jgi:hypothetical protein